MKVVPENTFTLWNANPKPVSTAPQVLLSFAQRKHCPEALCFIPGLNSELHTFDDIEIGSATFYRNAIKLLRLPTAGLVDAKITHSSVYAGKTMRAFFDGKHPDMLNLRIVMELVLLYHLTPWDLRLMTKSPCSFSSTEKDVPADIEKLKTLYGKKDVAKQLQIIFDQRRDVTLPARLLKGMEYPSYADILHVFRALGADPYEGIVALATQNMDWMENCRKEPSDPKAFSTKPVHLLINTPSALDDRISFAHVSQESMTKDSTVVEDVPSPVVLQSVPNTIPKEIKEVNSMATSSKISLKLRLCQPCDSFSWENDNPNKEEPGFHWGEASEDIIESCVEELDKVPFTPESIRSAISTIVKVPFKAQVTCMGKDFRATIDIF